MRWILLALILVALPVRADQFEDATWAYEAGDYATAVKLWRPLAEGGDVRAQLVLAIMHQDGNGVPLELVRAHMWFNIAGANGSAQAAASRDEMAGGLTVAQVLRAQALARAWADGHPRAGVRADLHPSAGHVDAAAQFERGARYEHGSDVLQNFTKALKWYGRAAQLGHAPGQRNLGLMYHRAKGVARDDVLAADWLAKAADQGDAPAQMALGEMYRRGQGVARDPVRAHMWLNLAGAQGEKAARVQRDLLAKGLKLEQIATAQHLARQWMAGHDRIVPAADKEGIRWRLDQALMGNVDQMFLVGMMYDIGHDVGQNYYQAVRWYLKAANFGHVGAQYNFGAAYYLGYGVPQDYVEAHKWFSIANVTGLKRAIVNRDVVSSQMTQAQIDQARVLKRDWMARYQLRPPRSTGK